jgi:hypothetical protein
MLVAIMLCAAPVTSVFAGEDEKSECADKSQYTLFNPTPANCLREFDPDRPDVTDSPFTVDAGHIQFESSLFSYALSSPDQQGIVTEESDILDTNIRLGITNYASRARVSLSFKPKSISMGMTTLRSRVRLHSVSFQD